LRVLRRKKTSASRAIDAEPRRHRSLDARQPHPVGAEPAPLVVPGLGDALELAGQALGAEQACEALAIEDGGHVLHAVAARAREQVHVQPIFMSSQKVALRGLRRVSSSRSGTTRCLRAERAASTPR
jgi:hypothetical protein